METIIITSETEIKRWIHQVVRDVVREELAALTTKIPGTAPSYDEPLLTRKEIAAYLHISLVTLHDWINHGLPCIKQGGRVYFLRSEVMDYVKRNRPKRVSQL
jgi:excisionase family DNA binding protein